MPGRRSVKKEGFIFAHSLKGYSPAWERYGGKSCVAQEAEMAMWQAIAYKTTPMADIVS